MAILTVNGSSSDHSSNGRLLLSLSMHFKEIEFLHAPPLIALPLFSPDIDRAPYPDVVLNWRRIVASSDSIIITTPAYLFNIPATLKNALEWLTTSGELDGKRTLALTYCPHPPRGEEAMQSMIWSLKALNAQVVAQCPLFQNELKINNHGSLEGAESIEMITEALSLLDPC